MAKVDQIKTPAQKVEELLGVAKKEITDEATKNMVKKIKLKLNEKRVATKILANITRDINMMKLELEQELESL